MDDPRAGFTTTKAVCAAEPLACPVLDDRGGLPYPSGSSLSVLQSLSVVRGLAWLLLVP